MLSRNYSRGYRSALESTLPACRQDIVALKVGTKVLSELWDADDVSGGLVLEGHEQDTPHGKKRPEEGQGILLDGLELAEFVLLLVGDVGKISVGHLVEVISTGLFELISHGVV